MTMFRFPSNGFMGAAPSPPSTPTWLAGKPLNEWFAIPSTTFTASAANVYSLTNNSRIAFSGGALKGSEFFLPACGGHGDYQGNEVSSIDLSLNAPAWVHRSDRSAAVQSDVPYYADGKPTSRHIYWSAEWSVVKQRIMLFGIFAAWGTGGFYSPKVAGFNPATNTWDAQTANTDMPGSRNGIMDSSGNAWALDGFNLVKWTAATDTYSNVATYGTASYMPLCYDPARTQLFSIAAGDGIDGGSGTFAAYKYSLAGTRTAITFNASPALTSLTADRLGYAGLEYDPANDRFLYYDGRAGAVASPHPNDTMGKVYVITPNSGTTWDVSLLSYGAGSVTPAACQGASTLTRFRYVPALKGFMLVAAIDQPVYFLRTA